MGMFSKKPCTLCGTEFGGIGLKLANDEPMCGECMKKSKLPMSTNFKKVTLEQMKEILALPENERKAKGCNIIAPVQQEKECDTTKPIQRIAFEDCETFFDALYDETKGDKIKAIKEYMKVTNVSIQEGKATIDREWKRRNDRPRLSVAEPSAPAPKISESQNDNIQQEQLELQKEMLEQQKKEFAAMAKCPKCGSTSLSGNKKGFGVGKAVVGAALTGGIGLVAGNIGAKKVRVTCLKCGKQFKA